MNEKTYGCYSLPIMIKFAKKYNVKYEINDTYSSKCILLKFDNGNVLLFDYPFNINRSASIKVCTNKDICSGFLTKLGFSVPTSINFTRRSTEKNTDLIPLMNSYLSNLSEHGLSYPLILKPSNLSQGSGIVKINNFEEAQVCFKHLNDYKTRTFILQQFVTGSDYRIVVLNGEVIQAYKRVPFGIIGDGSRSIYELVKEKIEKFADDDRDKPIDITDERIWNSVSKAGFTDQSILPAGKRLPLQDIANLSLGGTSEDYTNTISPYFKQISKDIAKSLGLELCGIDIISGDISDKNNREYYCLEVNSAPGLDNYLYSSPQKQAEYVNSLYEKIFRYLYNKNSKTKLDEEGEKI